MIANTSTWLYHRGSFAMIALVLHSTLDFGHNVAHADTRTWNDPTGGVYGIFTEPDSLISTGS